MRCCICSSFVLPMNLLMRAMPGSTASLVTLKVASILSACRQVESVDQVEGCVQKRRFLTQKQHGEEHE